MLYLEKQNDLIFLIKFVNTIEFIKKLRIQKSNFLPILFVVYFTNKKLFKMFHFLNIGSIEESKHLLHYKYVIKGIFEQKNHFKSIQENSMFAFLFIFL